MKKKIISKLFFTRICAYSLALVMAGTLIPVYPVMAKTAQEEQAQDDADVKAAVEAVANALGADGRILVRESGTEPVVRVMVEAGSTQECEKYVDQVIEVIKSKGYAV